MTAKWVCQCGVMHQLHHEWCSCGKYRSHGIQLAGGGGGRRSPSRKRRQFSKASDTVVPWTCTLCSQEVTTKACKVCGLRKSYLEAAQQVKFETVTPNHAIKPAPRIAGRPQVPAGTGAPEFYKKQLKALQTMRKNAIVLEDTALTAFLEQRIAQTKRLSLDARPLSQQLSTLVQTKEKKRLAIVAIDKDVCAAKLKLDELREKRKEMAADYKGLVKEMGMLKEEMLKTPPAEVEAASVVNLSDIDADSESNISGLWPKGETDLMLTEGGTGFTSATEQVSRVPDQADRAKYIQMLAVAFEKVMPTVPVQTVDLTDAQADGGEFAHAAQARLQAQAAEAIASTVFSIVEDMKPVFCKPRDRFAPY